MALAEKYLPFTSIAPFKLSGPMEALGQLTEICSLAGYLGHGVTLVVGYRQSCFRDLLCERLRLLHPAGTIAQIDGKRGETAPEPFPMETKCVVACDLAWSFTTALKLRSFTGSSQRTHARGLVWLCDLESTPRARDLGDAIVAYEPMGQPWIRSLLKIISDRYTSPIASQEEAKERFCSRVHPLLKTLAPRPANLQVNFDSVTAALPPQAPERARQLLEVAAALAAIRDLKSQEIVGSSDDLDAAVGLLKACAVADDWPTVPSHIIAFAELLGQIAWTAGGMSCTAIQEALNREFLQKMDDPRLWPPTATPSTQWTYSTVRRRLLELEKLGWLTNYSRGGEILWTKTSDLAQVATSTTKFWSPFSRPPVQTPNT